MKFRAGASERDTVRRRLRVLIGVLVLLIAAIGVLGSVGLIVATAKTTVLSRGYTPAADANSLAMKDMLDVETAVRGYLITGMPNSLQPYSVSRPELPEQFVTMSASMHRVDDHSLDAVIAQEASASQQWLTSYADPIAGGSGGPAAVDLAAEARAKQLFDRFRAANQAAATRLITIRSDVRASSQSLRSALIPGIIGASVLAVLVTVALGVRTAQVITRPLGRLWGTVLRLESGDLQARAPDELGPAEVRAVSRAVNRLGISAERSAAEAARDERLRDQAQAVSGAVHSAATTTALLDEVVAGLGETFGVDVVWLHTFPDSSVGAHDRTWTADGLHLPDAVAAGASDEQWRSLAGELWLSGLTRRVSDADGEPGARAWILAPLGRGGQPIGLIRLSHLRAPHPWSTVEATLLQRLAAEISYGLVQSHIIDDQRRAVESALQLDQARSVLVSTVTHELRTPLTSISGYLELLLDGSGGQLPGRAIDMLTIAERNTARLRTMVQDLLTNSALEAGTLRTTVQRVEVPALLRSMHAAMSPIASGAQVRLAVEIEDVDAGVVQGDPQQLEQAFTNLVSNAVKFTPEGGHVRVRHRVERNDQGSCVVVDVSDTGVGIPSADMPDLFNRFFRASNASAPGTGLGLAIVREIVETRHHGQVSVRSEHGVGSTFTVRLPATPD